MHTSYAMLRCSSIEPFDCVVLALYKPLFFIGHSLQRRFRSWQAWQQAPADAALALVQLSLAADRCALSSQRRASNGGSILGAALLLLSVLLTCGATVLLQVCSFIPRAYNSTDM